MTSSVKLDSFDTISLMDEFKADRRQAALWHSILTLRSPRTTEAATKAQLWIHCAQGIASAVAVVVVVIVLVGNEAGRVSFFVEGAMEECEAEKMEESVEGAKSSLEVIEVEEAVEDDAVGEERAWRASMSTMWSFRSISVIVIVASVVSVAAASRPWFAQRSTPEAKREEAFVNS